MPEASSYSAQNSTDLSAAVSPGRSHLISFCKSLAPSHLAFLLSRFLSLCHWFCFPSENLVSIFFFFLIWTLPGFLFLFPQAFSGPGRGSTWETGGGCVVCFLFWAGNTYDLENSPAPAHLAPHPDCHPQRTSQLFHGFRVSISWLLLLLLIYCFPLFFSYLSFSFFLFSKFE